jgi:limonene-1,2-epoxide hydrolase
MMMAATNNAKEIVLALVKALQDEDFERAREVLDEDFTFDGVLGSVRGADAYISQMRKLRFKYDVKKIFADGSDVCLLSDIFMGPATTFVCSWYQVERGKVRSLRVVFDPRPVLDAALAPPR